MLATGECKKVPQFGGVNVHPGLNPQWMTPFQVQQFHCLDTFPVNLRRHLLESQKRCQLTAAFMVLQSVSQHSQRRLRFVPEAGNQSIAGIQLHCCHGIF